MSCLIILILWVFVHSTPFQLSVNRGRGAGSDREMQIIRRIWTVLGKFVLNIYIHACPSELWGMLIVLWKSGCRAAHVVNGYLTSYLTHECITKFPPHQPHTLFSPDLNNTIFLLKFQHHKCASNNSLFFFNVKYQASFTAQSAWWPFSKL